MKPVRPITWLRSRKHSRPESGLAFRAICYLSREVSRLDLSQGESLLRKIDSNLELATKRGFTIPKDIAVLRKQVADGVRVSAIKSQALASIGAVKWDDVIGDDSPRVLGDD